MIKNKLKNLFRHMLFFFHQKKHERFYHDVMKRNAISNKTVSGEKEWIKYWSKFGVKAKPAQYRVFSKYIGEDVRIVPEDICHDFIEPILDPLRFVGYYADKNVFDKLFPKGVMPKTLLRKMGGFFYDENYEQLNMTDDLLNRRLSLSNSGRAIIKPTIDGMSGRGVCLIVSNGNGGGIVLIIKLLMLITLKNSLKILLFKKL